MTKRGLWFSLFLLLFFQTKLFARVEIFKQCTTICASDSEGTDCSTKCEFVFVEVNDNSGGSGDIDTDGLGGSDDEGSGGGTDANIYDSDGDGIMDCWKKLTGSSRITEKFGVSRDNSCQFHTGMDIGTALEGGELPLHSATNGIVDKITYDNTAGYYIRIKNDNGSYTVYCHLKGSGSKPDTNLEIGTRVDAGDEIATTNNSGESSGSHLDIKFYFIGNKTLNETESAFPNSNFQQSDIKYCSATNRTYINPKSVLNNGDCN